MGCLMTDHYCLCCRLLSLPYLLLLLPHLQTQLIFFEHFLLFDQLTRDHERSLVLDCPVGDASLLRTNFSVVYPFRTIFIRSLETQPTLLTSSAITTGHWSTNLACSSLSSLNPGHTLDILVPTRFLSPIGRSILILLHGPCRRKGHHRRAIVVTTRLDVHHGRSKTTGSRVSSS